jgi:hypothetical protein
MGAWKKDGGIMASTKELWDLLNVGKKITNGSMIVWYNNDMLYSDPEVDNPYMFNTDDKAEDWYEYEEVSPKEQLYCRWYKKMADGSIELNNELFYPVEKEPTPNHYRLNEAFTRKDILGV